MLVQLDTVKVKGQSSPSQDEKRSFSAADARYNMAYFDRLSSSCAVVGATSNEAFYSFVSQNSYVWFDEID